MGFFSGFTKALGLNSGTIKSGGLAFGYAAKLASDFNKPKVEGLSDAEQRALNRQKAEEDARKTRLMEALNRRTRAALGSNSLLYGTYAGANTNLGGASNLGTNSKGGAGG